MLVVLFNIFLLFILRLGLSPTLDLACSTILADAGCQNFPAALSWTAIRRSQKYSCNWNTRLFGGSCGYDSNPHAHLVSVLSTELLPRSVPSPHVQTTWCDADSASVSLQKHDSFKLFCTLINSVQFSSSNSMKMLSLCFINLLSVKIVGIIVLQHLRKY